MRLEMEKLREGMILESDLKDADGKILLPSGTRLSCSMIDNLSKSGVSSANIVDPADTEISNTSRTDDYTKDSVFVSAPVKEHLAKLFMNTDRTHPLIKKLMSLKLAQLKKMEG